MGTPISTFPVPCPEDDFMYVPISKKGSTNIPSSGAKKIEEDSPFDKLLMYPVFSNRRKKTKNVKNKVALLKPIVMYSHTSEKIPMTTDLSTVLRNLDSGGELEKNSTVLSSLLVAQYEDMDYPVTVNYAYGFSNTTGKCYFYRSGNFDHLVSKVDRNSNEDLRNANVSSRQIFLTYLHELMNMMAGTVWFNGYCITGPEDPKERIPVESVNVRSIPGRVTISVKDLDGIHVIRTKTRLEIYAKKHDDMKRAIWFRGPFANSLIVTEIEDELMSILIPAYCQDEIC